MRAHGLSILLPITLISGLAAGAVHAEASPGEERLRAQLKQTTLDLRAAQDELASLRAQQGSLKAQLDEAQAKASKPVAPTVDARAARLAKLQAAEIEDLKAKLDERQHQLEQTQAAGRDSAESVRAREAEVASLKTQIEPARSAEQACRAQNARLVEIGNELLDRYKDKGPLASLLDAEPFIRIHRLKLEEAAQDVHARIIDNTVR